MSWRFEAVSLRTTSDDCEPTKKDKKERERERERPNQLKLGSRVLQRVHLFLTGLCVFVMVPLLSLIPLFPSRIKSPKVQFFTGVLIGTGCPVKCDSNSSFIG